MPHGAKGDEMLPERITKIYGGSRKFKTNKRKIVREMRALLGDLRMGCAYFPAGDVRVNEIDHHLGALAKELSVENWGR